MEMASRILPSFFRRRRVVSPEELLELEIRLWDIAPAAAYELQKRRHWTPEMVAREAEKQRWVAEQKRLIAKESKRSRRRRGKSGAVVDGSVADLDKALGEEFERRRFYEELRLQSAGLAARRIAPPPRPPTEYSSVALDNGENDGDLPARGNEGYVTRRREILGSYSLTPAY
uniref:Uncharacterized protein n=1 Tax=Leersia perrieri TaxID=77586 RepID=A0A0D9WF83_9ORYZ